MVSKIEYNKEEYDEGIKKLNDNPYFIRQVETIIMTNMNDNLYKEGHITKEMYDGVKNQILKDELKIQKELRALPKEELDKLTEPISFTATITRKRKQDM